MSAPSVARRQTRAIPSRWWRFSLVLGRRLLIPLLVLLLLYGAWPYTTLWRMNRALLRGDQSAIEALVDLTAVRDELARRLNKDQESAIGALSDPFIEWLESGIRRSGTEALDHLVTLEWVQERLLAKSNPGHGFLPAVSHAFFEGPRDFRVRIGQADRGPLVTRLHLSTRGWRITMFYY